MVKKENESYKCEECGFHYNDRKWAERCQKWCIRHKSCNIEITAHSKENLDYKKRK